jgi:hypothetical protein
MSSLSTPTRNSEGVTLSNVRSLPLRRWRVLRILGKEGYSPNGWALEHIHSRIERFLAAVTTRQTGKTVTAAIEIDEGMSAPMDDMGAPWVGVLGPTYDKAELSVDLYITMLTETFGKESFRLNRNKHELTILDARAGTVGARLKWLSSDDPNSVIGFTFSKVITDESQSIPDVVFHKLRPTLDVRNARMVSFGTSDISVDQMWFQSTWLRGQDPLDTEYHSCKVTAYENPWMNLATIEDARTRMPDAEFRRLYLAEWVDLDGRVFVSFEGALLPEVPPYVHGNRYVMAVDFAIDEDFNVVMIGEAATKKVIFKDRWNKSEPIATYDRIHSIWERFGRPRTITDYTSLGGKAMSAELRERGIQVVPFTFSNQSKMEIITQLAADLQHERIRFPAEWEDVIRELRSFLYRRTPSGALTASAAAGYHDDTVVTLAMLNKMLRTTASGSSKRRNYLEGAPSVRYR